MSLELRSVTPDEIERFVQAEARGFGGHAADGYVEHGKSVIESSRAIAMFDGSAVVGTATSHTFETTVPGGAHVPTAGVAWVTVQPTHRRQGILTQVMTRQLEDVHELGEPLAALWPSESIIYGRFGYGMASVAETYVIERQHSAIAFGPKPNGRISFVDESDARKAFPSVFDRVRSARPGVMSRNDTWWDVVFADDSSARRGASAYFFAVYEGSSGPDGYVQYRIDKSVRKLVIQELMADTPDAYKALWEFCLGIDLLNTVEAHHRPVDDHILWLVADPKRVKRMPNDALWLRIVDVPEALSRRRYANSGRIVIEITDTVCPWNRGRFELDGGHDGAICKPTQASPDLSMTAADLGALYLGGTSARGLHGAGRVDELTSGAISLMQSMFATELPPWTPLDF